MSGRSSNDLNNDNGGSRGRSGSGGGSRDLFDDDGGTGLISFAGSRVVSRPLHSGRASACWTMSDNPPLRWMVKLRNFLRPQSRHNQHVPADHRSLRLLRRAATVLAILEAA